MHASLIPKAAASTPLAKGFCLYGFFFMQWLTSASCLSTYGYLMAMLQVKIKFRSRFLNLGCF